METSGHAALRENHFLDDGMYLVTLLIGEAMRLKRQGGDLFDLIGSLKEPMESAEVRLTIKAADFRTAGREAIGAVTDKAAATPGWNIAPDNREGVRITFDLDGEAESAWFLLRLSVHDPVLPLNAESDVAGGVRSMLEQLLKVLEEAEELDLTPLREYLQ
jgi:phosphomannomutase